MKKSYFIAWIILGLIMAFVVATLLIRLFPVQYTTPTAAIDPVIDAPPLTPLLHDVKG